MSTEKGELEKFLIYSAVGVAISVALFYGLLRFYLWFYSDVGGGGLSSLWKGVNSPDIATIYGAILGVVIAFVGAWVAIVLAQRAVTTSNMQARMEIIQMLDEKLDRVRRNFYGLANNVCMFCVTVKAINDQLVDSYSHRLDEIRGNESLSPEKKEEALYALVDTISDKLSLKELETAAVRIYESFAQIAEDDLSSDIWSKSCKRADERFFTEDRSVPKFHDIQAMMFFFRSFVFNDLPTSKASLVMKILGGRALVHKNKGKETELSVTGAVMRSQTVKDQPGKSLGEVTLIGVLRRLPTEDMVEDILRSEKAYGKSNPYISEYLQHWKFAPINYLSESFRQQLQ